MQGKSRADSRFCEVRLLNLNIGQAARAAEDSREADRATHDHIAVLEVVAEVDERLRGNLEGLRQKPGARKTR